MNARAASARAKEYEGWKRVEAERARWTCALGLDPATGDELRPLATAASVAVA